MDGRRIAQVAGIGWLVAAALNATGQAPWAVGRIVVVGIEVAIGLVLLIRPSRRAVRFGFALAVGIWLVEMSSIINGLVVNYDPFVPPFVAAVLTLGAFIATRPVPPKEPPPDLI